MGNEARVQLARFLLQRGELDLAEKYEFFHLLIKTLEGEKRWVKYGMKSTETHPSLDLTRQFGFRPPQHQGEDAPETVLGHLVHKFLIGAEMIASEKKYGGSEALALNTSLLYLAFVLYGPGVALHGDVAFADMSMKDLEKQRADFEKMLAIFPASSRDYLKRAHTISMERDRAILSGKKLWEISTTGQFLWAVVVASFLSKSLFEVRHGNIAFANTFHNMQEDVEYLVHKFYSFRELVRPQEKEINELMEKYPRWDEK